MNVIAVGYICSCIVVCFGLICESCGTCLFDDISMGLVIVESCVLVFLFLEIDLRVMMECSMGKRKTLTWLVLHLIT